MNIRDHISVFFKDEDGPPYTLHGYYKGSHKFSLNGETYIIVEGTVGDNIGRDLYIPEMRIKYITQNPRM